jgi:Ca-activated chloride channel family protein
MQSPPAFGLIQLASKGNPMTQPIILFSPRKPALSAQGGVLEVLVRVQAPDQPAQSQIAATPKRLALVVDRSGSMDGQPLTEALRCVTHIADCLTPADHLSVVVYDDQINVLLPLAPMQSPTRVRQLLATVESGGSTDLFGGWQAGARQLEGGMDSTISRVILLSDGQANHGLCAIADIEKHCSAMLARGVSTTTVGLGRGFNEDLMIAMARAGGGQQYYGQSADDLFDSFDEEFQLLQALCLRGLDLKLIAAPGVIIEPLGLVQQNPGGGYRLSDLAWGAECWIMLRLHLSPSAAGDTRDLLAASLQATTLEGQAITAHAAMLSLPVVDDAVAQALPADSAVQDRLQEVEFAQASQALRALVQKGDARGARKLLKDLQARFAQHPWLQDKLQRLSELAERDLEMMSKEAQFSAMRMSSRLSAKAEGRYSADETEVGDIPAYLRKKSQEGKGRKQQPEPEPAANPASLPRQPV